MVQVAAPSDAPPDPQAEPAPVTAAPPQRWWRRRRWVWPTLVVVGWCALIAAVLLWPVSGVHADRADRTETRYALPGIQPGSWIEQTFVAQDDGLSSVAVRFGTFGREMTCTLDTTLTDDRGAPVGVGVLPCAAIPDTQLVPAIVTSAIPDSAGRTYRLRITMRAVPGPDGVTYYGGEPTDGQAPATFSDPVTTPYALELHTEYGSSTRAVEQLDVILGRVGDYGAPWSAPVAVVALVVASIALLAAATIAPRSTGIVLVVAFAVTKGLLWSVVIPPFKGPDEPAHFAYAQFLAVDRAIPHDVYGLADGSAYSEELRAALDEFRQQPLGAVFTPGDRPDFGPAADDARQRLEEAGERSRHASGDGPSSGQSPAFYLVPAVIQGVAPGTIDARLGAARLWSVALGGVAVWATVMLGRRLFPGRESAALLLGVAVALQPMISQQTAIVTNDALLIAAGAVCAWIAVALLDPARSRWWLPFTGVAFGVALLAKQRAILFAPVLAIAWLLGRWRGARPAPWWWEAATGAIGVIVTYGVWYLYSTAAGPSSVPPRRGAGGYTLGDFFGAVADGWFGSSRTLWVDQLWGNFGWLAYPLPAGVQLVVLAALLVGTALALGWLGVSIGDAAKARRGRGPWSHPDGSALAANTAICFLLVFGTLAALYLFMYADFRTTGGIELFQGRYALPALPAMLALPVLALRRLVPRWSPVVPLAVIASAMAVLNVIGLSVVVRGSYL